MFPCQGKCRRFNPDYPLTIPRYTLSVNKSGQTHHAIKMSAKQSAAEARTTWATRNIAGSSRTDLELFLWTG